MQTRDYHFCLTYRLSGQLASPGIDAQFCNDTDAIYAAHATADALALRGAAGITVKIVGPGLTDIGIVADATSEDRHEIESQHKFGADYDGPVFS